MVLTLAQSKHSFIRTLNITQSGLLLTNSLCVTLDSTLNESECHSFDSVGSVFQPTLRTWWENERNIYIYPASALTEDVWVEESHTHTLVTEPPREAGIYWYCERIRSMIVISAGHTNGRVGCVGYCHKNVSI